MSKGGDDTLFAKISGVVRFERKVEQKTSFNLSGIRLSSDKELFFGIYKIINLY